MADIICGHTLYWASWNDLLSGLDGLQRYLDDLRSRPACPPPMKR